MTHSFLLFFRLFFHPCLLTPLCLIASFILITCNHFIFGSTSLISSFLVQYFSSVIRASSPTLMPCRTPVEHSKACNALPYSSSHSLTFSSTGHASNSLVAYSDPHTIPSCLLVALNQLPPLPYSDVGIVDNINVLLSHCFFPLLLYSLDLDLYGTDRRPRQLDHNFVDVSLNRGTGWYIFLRT